MPLTEDGWVAADGTARVVRGKEAQRLNAIADGRYLTDHGKQVYADTVGPVMDVYIGRAASLQWRRCGRLA
jgi:hypothetical protein